MRSINKRTLIFVGVLVTLVMSTITTSAGAQQVQPVQPVQPVKPVQPVHPVPPVPPAPILISSHDHGPHGFLGVVLTHMTPTLRTHFGAPKNAGVLVSEVEPDSPAKKAKVKVGDIIVAADGTKVDCSSVLQRIVRNKKAGSKLKLKIIRNKKPIVVQATMKEREREIIDLSNMIHVVPDDFNINLEGLEESLKGLENIKIEGLDKKMEAIGKHIEKTLNDPKVKKKLKELEKMELKEEKLQKRMKELEKKLKKLEKELQSRLKKRMLKKTSHPA